MKQTKITVCRNVRNQVQIAQMLQNKNSLHKYYKPERFAKMLQTKNSLQKCYKPRTVYRNVSNQEQCTEMFQTKNSLLKCYKPREQFAEMLQTMSSLKKYYKPRTVYRNITNTSYYVCKTTFHIKFALALTVQTTFEIIVITIFIFQKEYFEVVIVCPCLLVYQLYSAYSKQRNSVIVYFNNTYLLYYRIDCI